MGLTSGELWLADTAAFLEAYRTHSEGSPSLGTALIYKQISVVEVPVEKLHLARCYTTAPSDEAAWQLMPT